MDHFVALVWALGWKGGGMPNAHGSGVQDLEHAKHNKEVTAYFGVQPPHEAGKSIV